MALAQVQHSVGSTKPLLPKTQSQDDVAAEVAMTYTVYSKTGKCQGSDELLTCCAMVK